MFFKVGFFDFNFKLYYIHELQSGSNRCRKDSPRHQGWYKDDEILLDPLGEYRTQNNIFNSPDLMQLGHSDSDNTWEPHHHVCDEVSHQSLY
jgi:hypothetical protein